jgi:hypothetical protein
MYGLQRLHFKKEGFSFGATQHCMRSILFRNAIFRMIPDYYKNEKTPNQALQTMQFAVTPAASHPSRQQTACLI